MQSAQTNASQPGADVVADSVRADGEVLPDFLVGEPVLEQAQNFRFARAEFHAASRWLYFDIAWQCSIGDRVAQGGKPWSLLHATGILTAELSAFGKMLPMNDTKLIETLSNASSLELFELSRIIDRLLADPRRIVAMRNKLNLGKSVQFMDWRTGQMRSGKVVAIKDDQITVHEDGTRSQWKLSYAAIDPGADSDRLDGESPTINIQPPPQKPLRDDFRRGDKVSFTDKYLQPQIGTITRINQRTASVECDGGSGWRVPFAMLSHVMDI